LLAAWNEFKKGKRKKKDISQFEFWLEDNIFTLHKELIEKRYIHDLYEAFYICDPKRRHIHKASVRDRVMHQAIFRVLYPIFDPSFIYDSYSSRNLKGTHAGVVRLTDACRKVTGNWRSTAYALKCDIRKFFDSIDHTTLRSLLLKKIADPEMVWLIDLIFDSFEKEKGKALPLGNVTSQLFANVYMNEFDQFAKHVLKAHYYFRYCDDFIIVHEDRAYLESCIEKIRTFLKEELMLNLHPDKIEIRKIRQGIDFLGYVTLPHAHVIRTKTSRRAIRKLNLARENLEKEKINTVTFESTVSSYLGIFDHCQNRVVRNKVARFSRYMDQKR
jgi:retron-type reverse transcriptase